MSKVKYEVWLPKSNIQLESRLVDLFRSKYKNIVIKILDDYITPQELGDTLTKFDKQLKNFKRSNSIVIITEQHEAIPDYISVAPTEEEAEDIIDLEEIERNIFLDE